MANVGPIRRSDWVPLVLVLAAILVVQIYFPQRILAGLGKFSAFVVSIWAIVKVILFVVATATALWDSWRWKSWWRLLYWTCGIFAAVAFVLWAGSMQRAWEIAMVGALFLPPLIKGLARTWEFLRD